jgi:threonine/homoserine/homoserine lactone efflux protein
MLTLHPILASGLAGYFCALVISCLPFGPVNLTILNEGSHRGFVWAVLIGLGASTMECIYCAISFTGFTSFFSGAHVKTLMEVFSCAFIVFLGIKFLQAKSFKIPSRLGVASERLEARLESRLRPHSGFMTGLVRVMGNFGVLLFWIFLAAYLLSHDWVDNTLAAKAACVAGVALGTNTWFLGLSFAVSRGHGNLSQAALMRMQHLSGIVLIVFGLGQLVWKLSGYKINVLH